MSESGIRKLVWPLQPGVVPNIAGLVVELTTEIAECGNDVGGTVVLIEAPEQGADELVRFTERMALQWEEEGLTCLIVDAHPALPFMSAQFESNQEGFCEMLHYGLSPERVAVGREGASGMWIGAGAPWSTSLESPEEPERCLRLMAEQADRVLLMADAGDGEGLLSDLQIGSHYRLVLTEESVATEMSATDAGDSVDAVETAAPVADRSDAEDEPMFDGDLQAATVPETPTGETVDTITESPEPSADESGADPADSGETIEAAATADGQSDDEDEPMFDGDLQAEEAMEAIEESSEPLAAEVTADTVSAEDATDADDPVAEQGDAEGETTPDSDQQAVEAAQEDAAEESAEESEATPATITGVSVNGQEDIGPITPEQVMPFDVSVDDKTGVPHTLNGEENAGGDEDGFTGEGDEDGPAEFDLAKIAQARRRRILIPLLALCAVLMAGGGYMYIQKFGFALPGDSADLAETTDVPESIASVSTRLPDRVVAPYGTGGGDSEGSDADQPGDVDGGSETMQAGMADEIPQLVDHEYEETRRKLTDIQAEADADEGIEIEHLSDHEGRWLGEGSEKKSGDSRELASGGKAKSDVQKQTSTSSIPRGAQRQVALNKGDAGGSGSGAASSRAERVASFYLSGDSGVTKSVQAGARRRLESRGTWRSALDHSGSFLVHVESYQDSALGAWNARKQGFSEMGFILKPALIKGSEWFRLCVGPFPTLEAATDFRDRMLDQAGKDYCTVIPYRLE
ncbi:MAG: hypothetical protein GY835_20665 [bacterium]|nr:hypothetical protein [bacterium]